MNDNLRKEVKLLKALQGISYKEIAEDYLEMKQDSFYREYCIDNIESLHNEEWKEIEGTKGRYYISNYGRLKSYCKYNAILVKPYKNQYGYLRADIWIDGKRRTVLIHRLVAKSFIENDNPEEKDTVDHIDGNKHNNSAANLRWLSRSENVKAFYSGLVEQMIA